MMDALNKCPRDARTSGGVTQGDVTSMSTTKPSRRSRYTGSLYTRADSGGRQIWYGHWRQGGQQIKRRIGLKRPAGTRDGLTLGQAEAELRRLIADVMPTRQAGAALTVAQLGQHYLANLKRQGRKKATTTAVESILRVWLEPFFGERDLRRLRAEDVNDLIAMMEKGDRPGTRQKGDRRYGRPVCVKTLRNYIGTLSALLGFAEKRGWLEINVARRIDLPQVQRSEEIHFLVLDDVYALVQPRSRARLKRSIGLSI
jgi:integrase